MAKLIYNSKLLNEDEPVLFSNNRAFKYGDALFETIRIANGKICFFDSHISRIKNGMELLKMDVQSIDFSKVKKDIETLQLENKVQKGGRVRVTVFRDSKGLYTPETNNVGYLLEVSPLDANLFELNKQGLSIDLHEEQKKTVNKLSSLKSTNCLNYILAGQYKKEKGLDEVVLVNELGSIAECISSNIFVMFNGVYYTPSLNQGIVPGVMREQIIKLAKENKIEVQECPLSPQVLMKADEILLTNAISGIKWVVAYRSKRYYNNASKFWIEKLNELVG